MKKFVSCFLVVVIVIHCVKFSVYSVPTSSAPTSSVLTSSAPTSSAPTSSAPTSSAPTSSAPTSSALLEDDENLQSESFPDLVGGDAGFVLEVPESITFILDKSKLYTQGGTFYSFEGKFTMNCKNITEGYSLVVYADYVGTLQSDITRNQFRLDGNVVQEEAVEFSQAGEQQVGCSLQVNKSWLESFADGETRQAGTLKYTIDFY